MMKKRKILVPIFYRAHLGRLRSVLRAIQNHPDLELQIITAASAGFGSFLSNLRHSEPRQIQYALPWYINMWLKKIFSRSRIFHDTLGRKIRADGFPVHAQIPLFLDGGTPAVMAKSVGIGMIRIIDELQRLKPDIVFVNADRFEMMAVTLAAAYLNIPIAHNEGGDISGTIDESVRHAITKFAHIHFTATEKSRKRVMQMGENPDFVFNVGSPVIDTLNSMDYSIPQGLLSGIDAENPYLVVMAHPVTTESHEDNLKIVKSITSVLERLKMPTVFLGGNSDAYSRTIGPYIAEWIEKSHLEYVYYIKWMNPDNYFKVLAGAACAIGNSSSFIRESAYLGAPAVIVGSRQGQRERGENVIEVKTDEIEIIEAIKKQIEHGKYKKDAIFGDGGTGEKIAEILAKANPPIQKKFYEI